MGNWGAGLIARMWNRKADLPPVPAYWGDSRGRMRFGEKPNPFGYRLVDLAERLWGDQHLCERFFKKTGERRRGRQVALTDREWDLLRQRAGEAHLSAAAFVRVMCGLLPSDEECPVEECREVAELRRHLRDADEDTKATCCCRIHLERRHRAETGCEASLYGCPTNWQGPH